MAKSIHACWENLKQYALNVLPSQFQQWIDAFDGEHLTDGDLRSLEGLIDAYLKRTIDQQTFTIQFEAIFVRAGKSKQE